MISIETNSKYIITRGCVHKSSRGSFNIYPLGAGNNRGRTKSDYAKKGGNRFWTRHEGDKEFRTCFVGGLKNVGRVAKGGGKKFQI